MMYYRGKYIIRGKYYYTFKSAMNVLLLKRMVELGVDVGRTVQLTNLGDYLAVKSFFILNNKKVLEPEKIIIPCDLSFNNLAIDIIELKCE